MFTGIVEELGELVATQDLGTASRLTVHGGIVTADARHGDSIAVNGVCLTVVEITGETFVVDVMKETLDRSSLGALVPGDRVNLERAATLLTRMGGHLVQGHVDGTGVIAERIPDEHWELVRFSLPPELARYVVVKGSITVDGVSLTVASVVGGDDARPVTEGDPLAPPTGAEFSVSLIPATLAATTLGRKVVGDLVNLEVDIVAKYVEKLVNLS